MKKKILTLIIVFVLMIANMSNVFAAQMVDLQIFETAYKLSKENDINLPFVNLFEKDAVYDELVKKSGITIAESTLEIGDKMEGIQIIYSKDMLTISGEIKHGIIYGKNIVVEGKISEDTVIMGDSVQILETAIVEKDLVVVAKKLTVSGKVNGNVIGYATDTLISGTIEKDLRLSTSTIDLENSNILGVIDIDLPMDTDTTKIKEKYPEATVSIIQEIEESLTARDYLNIAIDGLKHVIVYTFVAVLVTKKKNQTLEKASARFIENSTFGILTATALFILSVFIVIGLVAAGVLGLGVIVWPVLIAFVSALLLIIALSQLIVGLVIYQLVSNKVSKYKIPAIAGIYAAIYALTKVPYIYSYAIIAINLVALGTVMTYIFKKKETYEFVHSSDKEVIKIENENEGETKTEVVEEKVEVKETKKENKNKNKK